MRAEVRQKLINSIPDIEGRAYEPQAASAKTQKPYLVVRQGVATDDTQWLGSQSIIEVWPYISRTSFQKVDDLVGKVLGALDKKTVTTSTGEVYLCLYLGSLGEDFVDVEWDVITRGLRFAAVIIPPQITTEPDPILALNNWLSTTFPELQLDPVTWNLSDASPAVYWHISSLKVTEQLSVVTWMEAILSCHVLAPTPNGRLQWIKKVTEKLAMKREITLGDGSPLFFKNVSADSQADYLKTGQIKLTSKYGILQPESTVQPLNNATIDGMVIT